MVDAGQREAKALHVPWPTQRYLAVLQEVARWPCTTRSTTASWTQVDPWRRTSGGFGSSTWACATDTGSNGIRTKDLLAEFCGNQSTL